MRQCRCYGISGIGHNIRRYGIIAGVLGSPKGMEHILPAETRATVRMPIKATVPFSNPTEQQCYLNDNHTLPPGWCIPVSSLPVRRKDKGQGNGREKQKTDFFGSRPGNRREPRNALWTAIGSPPGVQGRSRTAAARKARQPHPRLRNQQRAPPARKPRDGGKGGSKRFARRRPRHPDSRMPQLPRVHRRQPSLPRMRGGDQRCLPDRGGVRELHQRHLRRRSRNDPTPIRQAHRQIPPRHESLVPHPRPLDRQTRMHPGAVSHFAKSGTGETRHPTADKTPKTRQNRQRTQRETDETHVRTTLRIQVLAVGQSY